MSQILQTESTRAAARPSPSGPPRRRHEHGSALQPFRDDAGRTCACGGGCPRCAEHERDALELHSAPPEVAAVLRSSGRPVEDGARATAERTLGHDFSTVHVHADDAAAEAAASVGARAFTVGEHVVFGEGQYRPDTTRGQNLFAHELTHVVQQRAGGAGAAPVLQAMPDRITSITVNLATSTVSIALDDGGTITGSVATTNLEEGLYTARWNEADESLLIEPGPSAEDRIYFQVTGTRPFIQRYARLRREITSPIPFNVIAAPAAPREETTGTTPPATDPRGPDVVYLTPEEAQERCRTGNLPNIMTFPLRMPRGLWRFSVAPISAHRDGEDIVVSQPVNAVFADEMFRREVRTLPLSTFLGGVRLKPNELVRVRLYDDDERLVCVTGEGMLRLSEATDTATLISIIGTIIEAGSLFIPAGLIARPVLGAARTVTAAAMIGTAEAVPVVAGRVGAPAIVEAVEQRAVAGVVSETTTRAVSAATQEAVVESTVQAGTQAGVRLAAPAGTGAVSQVAVTGTAVGTTQAVATTGTEIVEQGAVQAARAPIEGATEVSLTQAEYHAALSQVFPSQYLNQVTQAIDGIGQRAAQRAVANPQFVAAAQAGNWRLAGTLFHSAAAQEARALPASALPAGWTIEAERVIQAGAGGSRADLLLRGPASQLVEFDWKTSGTSALSSAARREMARHSGQITTHFGGTLTTQESRSWVDFVRALLPGINWP